jgi:light-regulated signal transduction histidine kinase (bacteriophytochrome)
MPAEIDDIVTEAIQKALKTKTIKHCQYTLNIDGNDEFFDARIKAINEQEVLMIVRNFTELARAQQSLSEKISELSEKNRELEKYITSNKELEKFAYIASHDLKEPLRTIIGFSQLLERDFKEKVEEHGKEYINHIILSTERMQSLINGLLEYSRVESKGSVFREVDLNALLEQVQLDLSSSIQKNEATLEICPLPIVMADQLQLRQLFQNLISNSIKFRGEEAPQIEICCEEREDHYEISVQDNGIGFDMNYEAHIFEIFKRLHSSAKYPGSGIGLAICRKIVERHGGQIWVASKPDQGTTIYFSLKKT